MFAGTLTVSSKELPFEIRQKYSRTITKNQLESAVLLRDIIPGYAHGWITDYIAVEILTNSKGKISKATGKNEKLTADQKSILLAAEAASHIVIKVHYKDKNSVTSRLETREMNVSLMVIPEKAAEFVGGSAKMTSYLKANVIDNIDALTDEYMLQGIVSFTVNENGKVRNVILTKSTGSDKIDRLLIDTILKMPAWSPASNSKGIKMSQEFEFSVGNQGC